jgi:hypothetical protein
MTYQQYKIQEWGQLTVVVEEEREWDSTEWAVVV